MPATRRCQKSQSPSQHATSLASSGASATGSRLRDRVIAEARAQKDGRYKKWVDKLPRQQQEEVLALKAEFLSEDMGLSARSLAKAIVSDLESQGIECCGLETMRTWLTER